MCRLVVLNADRWKTERSKKAWSDRSVPERCRQARYEPERGLPPEARYKPAWSEQSAQQGLQPVPLLPEPSRS